MAEGQTELSNNLENQPYYIHQKNDECFNEGVQLGNEEQNYNVKLCQKSAKISSTLEESKVHISPKDSVNIDGKTEDNPKTCSAKLAFFNDSFDILVNEINEDDKKIENIEYNSEKQIIAPLPNSEVTEHDDCPCDFDTFDGLERINIDSIPQSSADNNEDIPLTEDEEKEGLQFTKNFKQALKQAESRETQRTATNCKTFQPLRRAALRISNRIKFLQEQLQQEVASEFSNKKTIERLKKQLEDAEEKSANFQSIRTHQRSVSRSRPIARARLTTGKRERPYRHWLGLSNVVTPGMGVDSRFIISSKEDKGGKFSGQSKIGTSRKVKTCDIAVNTIKEETDVHQIGNTPISNSENIPANTFESDKGRPDTKEENAYEVDPPSINTKSSCVDDVGENEIKIKIENKEVCQRSDSFHDIDNERPRKNEKSVDDVISGATSGQIEIKTAIPDLQAAIEELDIKDQHRHSGINLSRQTSKPTETNYSDISNKFLALAAENSSSFYSQTKNTGSEFLINFDKEPASSLSSRINTLTNSFSDSLKLDEDLSITSNKSQLSAYPQKPFMNNCSTYRKERKSDLSSIFTHNTIKVSDYSGCLANSYMTSSPSTEQREKSPQITKKRFPSPYYVHKDASTCSSVHHPRPPGYGCNGHKHGIDTQNRIRRHRDRSSYRMASRSGSRSLARPYKPPRIVPGPLDAVELNKLKKRENAPRHLTLHAEEASPMSLVDSDLNQTLEAASRARLMQRIYTVRKMHKGTKYIAVVANRDYKGKLPGQLSFKAGQSIKLRCPETDPPDDLCYGYYRNGRLRKKKKGLFPMSCIELTEKQTAL